jgi:hypothetical protein
LIDMLVLRGLSCALRKRRLYAIHRETAMRIAPAILAVAALALSACGADAPPPPKAAAAQPTQPLPDSNVFSSDVKALQKAKDVQKTVDEQQKAQEKAIQDAGG